MLNVKQQISWIWQNAEKVLVIVFFATFTLSTRKVFLTPYSFLNEGFNEYMTMSISWADMLMIGTIIIYNIKLLTSQFRKEILANTLSENVIRNKSSVIRNYYRNNVSRETLFLVLFLFWTGFSIFWASYKPISIYRFVSLSEIMAFTLIAISLLRDNKWLKMAIIALIVNGLIQSILGIGQFLINRSLGLRFLGESILGPNIDGVAKIIINSEKYIRAYGTLPHPNILAGFLVVPLFIIIGEILRRNVSYETSPVRIPDWLLWPSGLILGSGFIMSFSRSAFLGFSIGLLIYFVVAAYLRLYRNKLYTCLNKTRTSATPAFQTIRTQLPHRVPKINFGIAIVSIIVLAFITIMWLKDTSFFSKQSLQERSLYNIVSYETISTHPIKGVGLGQFVLNAFYNYPNLESWQYQPAHNMYLLIFSELGIFGLVLAILFSITFLLKIWDRVRTEYNLTYLIYYCIIISYLVLSFFDHYFWDLKAGMIIFVLPFILFHASTEKLDNPELPAIIKK